MRRAGTTDDATPTPPPEAPGEDRDRRLADRADGSPRCVGLLAGTPVFLLHNRITIRDAMPGGLLATAGLLGLRVLSSHLFTNWLNWYSKYYGGIRIVMAIFFWLVLATTVLVVTAALSPAYALRRAKRIETQRAADADHAPST